MLTRRQFANLVTIGAGGVVTAAIAAPIVGMVLSPLFNREQPPQVWRRVGDVSHLPLRHPTRYVVQFPVGYWNPSSEPWDLYVVRLSPTETKVLSNICTHMQCAVRWQPPLGQFECPCHGGLYTISGQNVGGPPPKPLPQYVHRYLNGVLYVSNRLEESI